MNKDGHEMSCSMALWASAASLDHSGRSLTAPTMANFGEYWTHTKQEKGYCLFNCPLYYPTLTPGPSSPWLFCKVAKKSIDQ